MVPPKKKAATGKKRKAGEEVNVDDDIEDLRRQLDAANREKEQLKAEKARQETGNNQGTGTADAKPAGRKCSRKDRKLVRWDAEIDLDLLLAVQSCCSRAGVRIPWGDVARTMGEKFTEGAITQHLAKLRVKRENIKKQRNDGQGDGSEDSDEAQAQPNKSKRGGKRSIAGTKGSKKSQSAAAKPGPSFKKRNPPRTATRHVIIDTDDELEDEEAEYEDEEGEYGDSDFPQTMETMAAREQIHNRMRERQSAIREKGKGNASAQRLAQQHDENSETVNQGYGVRDASNDFDITMAERNESVGHDQSQSQSTHTSTSGAGTKTGKSKLVILKLQPHLLQRFSEEPSAGSYVQEPPATPPQAPCEVRNQNPPRRSQFIDYNYDAPDVVFTDPLSGYNYPGWDDLPGQYNPQVAPHAPGGNPFYFGPASPSPGALNLAATQAMAAGWSPSPAIGQYIAPIDFDSAGYHREATPPTLRAFMDAEEAGGPAYVDPRMAGIDVPAADMGLPRGMEVEVDSGETETEDSLKWEGEESGEE